MAKPSLISSLLAVTLVAVILPIIYSKPQGTFQYYSDYLPKSQQRRRIDDHPISIKYHNGRYGYVQQQSKVPSIADVQIPQSVPNTSQKPKEVLVFLNERSYPQGKSLQHPSNIENRYDALKNQTSNALPAQAKGAVKLPEIKDALPRDHPMPTVRPSGIRPNCAKEGQVFCEEADNYPAAELEKILKSSPEKYLEAFGTDISNTVVITQRIDADEESLCESEERVIRPKVGLTVDNEYEFIVNLDNYTQGIRVEECKNAGAHCRMIDNFPNGYRTECKQKYIYRNLLGYGKEGRVEKNLYRFPSCCQCVLKPNYSK